MVLYFLKRYKKNNDLKYLLPIKGFNNLCFLYRLFIFFPIFLSNVILSGSGSGNCNSISSVFLGELDFTVTKMLSGFKEEEPSLLSLLSLFDLLLLDLLLLDLLLLDLLLLVLLLLDLLMLDSSLLDLLLLDLLMLDSSSSS